MQDFTLDKDSTLLLQAMRGRDLNDADTAVAGQELQLIDLTSEALPLTYDAAALQAFFQKRPLIVAKRLLQLAGSGGGFVTKVLFDNVFKRMEKNPDLEIQRAGELRDLITSLGPFWSK
jgi:aarF domain-containing kinase